MLFVNFVFIDILLVLMQLVNGRFVNKTRRYYIHVYSA